MWRFAQASIVGRSHQRRDQAGQDATGCQIVTRPDGSEYLIASVADGAGSASRGGDGARAACSLFVESFRTTSRDNWEDIGSASQDAAPRPSGSLRPRLLNCRSAWSEGIADWLTAFQTQIAARAEREGLTVRDFACTFLGAVVTPDQAGLAQIGDGALVVSTGDGCCPYQTFVWPQRGEYANETYFATDLAAGENLVADLIEGRIDEIALFTDGLQGLVLDDRQRLPHAPFFQRVFAPVRAAPPGHAERLSDALATFLASPRVQARTDDDLTLILATRRDGATG